MKKGTKDNIGCIITVASIAFVIGMVWVAIASLAPPDKDKAEKTFTKDHDLLVTVVRYLENSEYMNFYINEPTDNDKVIVFGTHIEIMDKAVSEAIDHLLENRGYHSISRRGNTISFLRWTRWRDFGAGLAYSINNEYEPELDYLSELESLSENGWYYYEVN